MLSSAKKVCLTGQCKEGHGLNHCLKAIGLPKSTYYYWINHQGSSKDDQRLMQHTRAIIRDHPASRNFCDGYRRILPELRERSGEQVNHKRLRRLLSDHELALPRQVPKQSPSPVQEILERATGQLNLVSEYLGTGLAPEPLEVFSTDFTELHYAEGARKAYLMAVVDVGSRYALSWAVGPSANRELALRCWERVRARMAGLGQPLEGTILHSDLDSVRAGYDWLRALLLEDGLRVSYSERGAKDNPRIESQRRNFCQGRMKTEIGSRIVEARSFPELERVIDERFRYYDRRRWHSQIGNQPSLTCLANLLDHPELICSMVPAA